MNNKVYVGSSVNVDKRLADHRRKLGRGRHCSTHLQAAWDKYGSCNFSFKKLLVCDGKDILFYEQRLIDGYEAMNPEHGYNKRVVAKSNAGMKHSEETKRKVSAGMKGRIVSAETREKIRIAKLGKHHTDHAKKKMSSARVGVKLSAIQAEKRGVLTISKVAEIRSLYFDTDVTQLELSGMFGVSRESIGGLLRGKTWAYSEAGGGNLLSVKERKNRHVRALPRGDDHHNFGKDWGAVGRVAAAKSNRHPLSESQKIKLSEAKIGEKMPDGFGAKMRLTRLGKTMSDETKRKKSEARKNMNVEKADAIRSAHSEGVVLVTRLAEMFSVSKKVVRSVLAGETWVASGGT